MANMRQPADNVQAKDGIRTRHSIATDRNEGSGTVFTRLTGAAFRAVMVIALLASPSIGLAETTADTAQIVALVCIAAAIFVFVEYNANSPSLIEFRDAPPFNRIRFLGLFFTIFALTLISKGASDPTSLTAFFDRIGKSLAEVLDFSYSPVRLVVLMLPQDASASLIDSVRVAAGLSYFTSLLSLAVFVLAMRLGDWPNRQGDFNVWVNLPTFDPTSGGDAVDRLERSGQINLILGFLLPFVIPALVKLTGDLVNPISLQDPHSLIWIMTAWAFIPASLIMRGIAIIRVAQMIAAQRERAYLDGERDGALPA